MVELGVGEVDVVVRVEVDEDEAAGADLEYLQIFTVQSAEDEAKTSKRHLKIK